MGMMGMNNPNPMMGNQMGMMGMQNNYNNM